MNERRIECRYLCADIVRVMWQWREGQEMQSADAVLEDIAARGICIQMEDSIPEGARVHVFLGESDFVGYVAYCKYQEIGYFIGIHFDDASRWNTHIFKPQHLTNLQDLAFSSGGASDR